MIYSVYKFFQIDDEKKKMMPGIVGYIAKQGDTLWSVAKEYRTTVERLCQMNNLEKQEIKIGDKLIVVKE